MSCDLQGHLVAVEATYIVKGLPQSKPCSPIIALTSRVECLGCGELTPRQQFQDRLAVLNPEAAEAVQQLIEEKAAYDAAAKRIIADKDGSSGAQVRLQAITSKDWIDASKVAANMP